MGSSAQTYGPYGPMGPMNLWPLSGACNAESEAWKCSASEAEEAAQPYERHVRQQEQAVSRRERVGGYRAQVRLRRPPEQEAGLPPLVDRPDQRRGTRARAHVSRADRGPQV